MKQVDVDVIVVGAGFSGLYMLYRLRKAGFSTRVFEAGDGVGGTWYWNRYPGARCDIESIYYNYTFSEELYKEWSWNARYAEQEEILRYLNFVADKFDLRSHIQFKTRVQSAHYDEESNKWSIHLDDGTRATAKYFITGVGCLSAVNMPTFNGLDHFEGECYHTGHWPRDKKVAFKGKRIGIIGTGSSAIQAIPVIAEEAGSLLVFQRTPQYSEPARNHPHTPAYIKQTKEHFHEIKKDMRESAYGMPYKSVDCSALDVTKKEREQLYEKAWERGDFFAGTFNDLLISEAANETVATFIRSKIRETIHDSEIAKKLTPSHYYGTKRPIKDTNYFETFNRENVTLVDVKQAPIVEMTSTGLRTTETEYDLDMIIFATGYDAMIGPLMKIDIQGKDGMKLKEKWGIQVKTYLGLANAGFPNMFMITGPESPSVLSNMPVSIEQHVEWIIDCMEYLRTNDIDTIEAKGEAEEAWSQHCREVAEMTLYTKTESWYTGANIDGKRRGFPIYLGGLVLYGQKCDEIASKGYEGFSLKSHTNTLV
jgi:cation diffusion facilitator CzcD-associated flavoprotein CzcO